MVKNRQKGITKAYRNDKKDVDTRDIVIVPSNMFSPSLALRYDWLSRVAFLWGTTNW
jgi:hypothetical protein